MIGIRGVFEDIEELHNVIVRREHLDHIYLMKHDKGSGVEDLFHCYQFACVSILTEVNFAVAALCEEVF